MVPVLSGGSWSSPFGQMLLLSALLADFVHPAAPRVVITLESSGATDLLLFLVLLVAFFGAARLGRWATRSPSPPHRRRALARHGADPHPRRLRLIVAWVVLSSALGIEGDPQRLPRRRGHPAKGGRTVVQIFEEKLDAIGYGLFIPIFFLMVGTGRLRRHARVSGALWLCRCW
ncbi:MAG: hypothetical protein R2862_01155 [Thermoanaerobaculia bacterium]